MEVENIFYSIYRYFQNLYLLDLYVWKVTKKDNEIIVNFSDYSSFIFNLKDNNIHIIEHRLNSNLSPSFSSNNVPSIDLYFKPYRFYKKSIPFGIAYFSNLLN